MCYNLASFKELSPARMSGVKATILIMDMLETDDIEDTPLGRTFLDSIGFYVV